MLGEFDVRTFPLLLFQAGLRKCARSFGDLFMLGRSPTKRGVCCQLWSLSRQIHAGEGSPCLAIDCDACKHPHGSLHQDRLASVD